MSASKILVLQVRTLYFNPSKRSVPQHSFVSVTTTNNIQHVQIFQENCKNVYHFERYNSYFMWNLNELANATLNSMKFLRNILFQKRLIRSPRIQTKKCNSFDGCPNEKYQLILTGPKKNWRTQNLFQFLLRSDVLGDAGCQMVLLKWLEGKVCSFKRRR